MKLSTKINPLWAAIALSSAAMNVAFSVAGESGVEAEKMPVAISQSDFEYVNSRMAVTLSKDLPIEKRYEAWAQVHKVLFAKPYQAVFKHLKLDETKFFALGHSIGRPLIEQTLLQASTDLWEHKNDYNHRRAEAALKRITYAQGVQTTLGIQDGRLLHYRTLLENVMKENGAKNGPSPQ